MADVKPIVNAGGKLRPVHAGETVPVANGGTGAATAAAARTALDVYATGEVDAAIAAFLNANDAFQLKGVIDCSANPNYPAASAGHTYRVSVAGKIGGGSGVTVEAGDILLCLTDSTASGNQATVGAAWTIFQVNIIGALVSADIGSLVQAFAANLTAFAALSLVADRLPYANGTGTLALATFTAAARTLLACADASAMRAALGLIIDTDVPSKSYVDGLVQGLSWKKAVRVATTANGTLASAFENGDTVDGVALATGDRILLKNQSSGAENGIYTVNASGAPTRATDADAGAELVNATVYVSEGTANADTQWTCTTNATITPGSTSLAFAQLSSGGGSLLASNNLSDVANAATAGANIRPVESLIIACGDETTAITTGTGKVTFRIPYAFTVTAVRASVTTAPTGSTIIVDINEAGTTILSTKLSIDASEKTSTTAASAAVISDASLADDAEITIDFDQVGSTIAGAGVKVTLIGNRT